MGALSRPAGILFGLGPSFCGEGTESEYAITLGYETDNVNELPAKDRIFIDVVKMLKTLNLKPPILISRISPDSAPVGTTVTVYGSGFNVPGFTSALVFTDFPKYTRCHRRLSRGMGKLLRLRFRI